MQSSRRLGCVTAGKPTEARRPLLEGKKLGVAVRAHFLRGEPERLMVSSLCDKAQPAILRHNYLPAVPALCSRDTRRPPLASYHGQLSKRSKP